MEHIKHTLQGVIENIGKRQGSNNVTTFKLFMKSLAKGARKHVKCSSVRQGVLVVNVDSSAWLYQLNLKKEEILKNMDLKDIRFRIGEVK